MSMTPRRLMCFCYSGGERMANADGSLGKYMGGVSEATVIEEGISFEEESNLLSSSPSTAEGEPPSSSKDSLTICHEMGLVPYSQQRGEDILSGDGQLFDNHRLFKKAVILFAALNKFTFKYLDNSRHYYRKKVVVVTDRNPGLLRAVKELFGEECNAWCVRHVKENFSKFATGKGMKRNPKKTALHLFTKIAYACDERLYGVYLTKLFGLSPELSKWVEENGPQHWSNARFPYQRWDKLYTNIAESFNNWLLKLRDLDIIQFMKGHVTMTTDMLYRHNMEAGKWHPLPIGRNIDKMIKESQEKARVFTCRPTSPTEFIMSTSDWKSHAVKLHPCYYSCLRWQMKGIPYKHAVHAIEGSLYNIYNLVDRFYRVESQLLIYMTVMSPVPLHDMPSSTDMVPQVAEIQYGCEDLDIATSSSTATEALRPPATKRPAGRPKKKRIESQFQEKQTVFCGLCHEPGHNRRTCKSPLPG
ncbi:hypothetical protein RHSIM_Rhsim12G0084000 [Rhododendron simsii]|uniref:Protein FAR1-RELATED SEQUENCE n=1 Tax=Rhododendron simsii TaxID=118357 RepID=A0A834G3F7_RHOSS|nr:hypothetical protein RHSIM_Rhsim12G0084000 [Rhododendron simsii]